MRPIDGDELYARLKKRYYMHNMCDRFDRAARAVIKSCMEAVERSKTITIVPPPNAPMTLEELWEMDGEPVWVEFVDNKLDRTWAIMTSTLHTGMRALTLKTNFMEFDYGSVWIAYRRKPEEGET